jgi:hypothetical protein
VRAKSGWDRQLVGEGRWVPREGVPGFVEGGWSKKDKVRK